MINIFNNIDSILYYPLTSPAGWCENQPCIVIGSIILVQPSSTVFVYLLGIITIILGFNLMRFITVNKFVAWWGISLFLWGVGAIFAGTSYQIFSYEIKCTGRLLCLWTSGWEIAYLILSVGSVNAMLIAQANLDKKRRNSKYMVIYGIANYLIYLILILFGAIIPVQFLISFELMIIVLAPTILYLLIFNVRMYSQLHKQINRSLLIVFASLIIIIGFYFLYFMLDITNILWEQGIWFSENDILHITLIMWMIYIFIVISRFGKENNP